MKIRKKILLLNMFIISSCYSFQKKETILGVYVEEKLKSEKIILNKNSYLLLNKENTHHPEYICCDTLSKGSFTQINKDFLELSSFMKKEDVDMLVFSLKESIVENSDSIVFNFKNPIENYPNVTGQLVYQITISTPNDVFILESKKPNLRHKYIENIEEIAIVIFPRTNILTQNIGLREITLFPLVYKLKNLKSNYFEIDIPDLTFEYVNYERINKEYLRIMKNGSLMWRGKVFSKINERGNVGNGSN